MSDTPDNVKEICLYAWVGEDEFGSGKVGLKQGLTNAGYIPLVAVEESKVNRVEMSIPLQSQSDLFGKTIRLCKFVFVEEIVTLQPESPQS